MIQIFSNKLCHHIACCDGISGIEIQLSGDPLNYQFGLVGNYILQDDLVNGKHYWIKENGAYGIWYTDRTTNAWMVGSIGNLGNISFFLCL